MTKINKPKIYLDTPEQRLSDFLFVYYPVDLAKIMKRSPEAAFINILEDIEGGISPMGRLSAYVHALHDAISLMEDSAQVKFKKALKGFKPVIGSAHEDADNG